MKNPPTTGTVHFRNPLLMSRVFFHNIHGLQKTTIPWLCKKLNDKTYDIVLLAETWSQHRTIYRTCPHFVLESIPALPQYKGKRDDGLLILARTELIPAITIIATHAFYLIIEVNSNRIAVVYFPPRLPADYVTEVCQGISAYKPTFILGDINVNFEFYSKTCLARRDRFPIIQELISKCDISYIPTATPCAKWDYVFGKPHLVHECDIIPIDTIPELQSDHLPLVVTMDSLENQTTPVRAHNESTRYRSNFLKSPFGATMLKVYYDRFSSEFDLLWTTVSHHGSREEKQWTINALDDCLTRTVQRACSNGIGKRNKGSVRRSKEQHVPQDTSTLATIKYVRKSRQHAGTLRHMEPSTGDIVGETASYFSNVYRLPDKFKHLISKRPPDLPMPDRLPEAIFDNVSLAKIIKEYPDEKACGEDGIHILILKHLENTRFYSQLTDFFNLCVSWGITPQRWNSSLVHLIPKPDQKFTPSTGRPIALTVMFRRIFEHGILKHIVHEDWAQLSPLQAGFRSGYSTYSHAMLANDAHHYGYGYRVFLDLKAAYDTAVIQLLLDKVIKRGAPEYFTSIVYHLFTNCSSLFLVNQERTEPIARECSLFQGSVLSPLLFNFYINDLAERLESAELFPRALFFADDIAVFGQTPQDCQLLINVCQQWCEENGMSINIGKCGIICPTKHERPKIYVGDQLIPVVEEYTYLGFPMGREGILWERHIQSRNAKAQKTLNFLRYTIGNRFSAAQKALVYRIFVYPNIEFGGPLLMSWLASHSKKRQKELLSPFDQTHRKGLQWILGSFTRAVRTQESMTGIPDILLRFSELTCLFSRHLVSLHPSNPLSRIRDIVQDPRGKHRAVSGLSADLVSKSLNHELLTEFNTLIEQGSTLTLRSFLRKKRLEHWNIGLGCYILPKARLGAQIDRCLSILSHSRNPHQMYISSLTQHEAIRWRLNCAAHLKICSHCQVSFSRIHVNKCPIVWHHPLLLQGDLLEEYSAERTIPNYTIFDFLLNSGRFYIFHELYTAVLNQLQHRDR
jgi:hypothetical protein